MSNFVHFVFTEDHEWINQVDREVKDVAITGDEDKAQSGNKKC